MVDDTTLLGFIARRHAIGLEDVATNALYFILSRSTSAKQALTEFLGRDFGPVPVAEAKPWGADTFGAKPDLACFDEHGVLVALVESKFWAPLTSHQPVTYWRGLPIDRPAALLFLAPRYRVDESALWDELVDRLRAAGHLLGPAHRADGLVTAPAAGDQRRLMLASWELLLDRMTQRTKHDGDAQACFEVSELQGLVNVAVTGGDPASDENSRQLVADTVAHLRQSGWADTTGLAVGQGFGFHGRYLRIAGAAAWLGIDYEALKQTPETLWLWFGDYSPSVTASTEAVRSSLGSLAEPAPASSSNSVRVPVPLPAGADHDATLDALVAEVERIARTIDPSGPTYAQGGTRT